MLTEQEYEYLQMPSTDEQERIVSFLDCFNTFCNVLFNGFSAEINARRKHYKYYYDKLLIFKKLRE